jgi:hypothetical protein
MGTIRLLVESCDQGMPAEVGINRLSELLPDRGISYGSTSATRGRPKWSSCAGSSASTSWHWRI